MAVAPRIVPFAAESCGLLIGIMFQSFLHMKCHMRSFTLGIGFPFMLALMLDGCARMEPSAPPVNPAMVDQGGGASGATLNEGRRIFLTLCTKYHWDGQVTSHTTIEWHGIVDGIADHTKLTAHERSALLDYLAAANAAARLR
jgi:hypothetical protein